MFRQRRVGKADTTKMQSASRSSTREVIVQALPRDDRCAATARKFVFEQLAPEADGPQLSNALLVVSELATNAYRHGEGRIEVRMHRREQSIRIEVVDDGAGPVHRRETPADVTGGWGLRVVEEIADDWGTSEGTTHVWAELAL
jgi:anti-sigma regulatory factor (Ser/Thr protein kinase)